MAGFGNTGSALAIASGKADTENIRKNTKFHENGILRHARKRWMPAPFSKWKRAVRA